MMAFLGCGFLGPRTPKKRTVARREVGRNRCHSGCDLVQYVVQMAKSMSGCRQASCLPCVEDEASWRTTTRNTSHLVYELGGILAVCSRNVVILAQISRKASIAGASWKLMHLKMQSKNVEHELPKSF